MGHNGVPEYVRLVSCDMSLGFRKGIRECLPNVRRIVDKFHVARHANEAVDKAGKTEGRSNPLLKRTKYLWLRNEESLAELQLETKRNLTRQRLRTGRACRMREVPQDVYADSPTPSEAWVRLHRLCSWTIVYGQINVYGVTTKSERHKRSYWTRTADGNGIGGRKAPVPYGS